MDDVIFRLPGVMVVYVHETVVWNNGQTLDIFQPDCLNNFGFGQINVWAKLRGTLKITLFLELQPN